MFKVRERPTSPSQSHPLFYVQTMSSKSNSEVKGGKGGKGYHFGHVNFLEDQIIQITDNVGKGMARAEATKQVCFFHLVASCFFSFLFRSSLHCKSHNIAIYSLVVSSFSWISYFLLHCFLLVSLMIRESHLNIVSVIVLIDSFFFIFFLQKIRKR